MTPLKINSAAVAMMATSVTVFIVINPSFTSTIISLPDLPAVYAVASVPRLQPQCIFYIIYVSAHTGELFSASSNSRSLPRSAPHYSGCKSCFACTGFCDKKKK
jgi:hypothetical protein